jgi:hypothetical protein
VSPFLPFFFVPQPVDGSRSATASAQNIKTRMQPLERIAETPWESNAEI